MEGLLRLSELRDVPSRTAIARETVVRLEDRFPADLDGAKLPVLQLRAVGEVAEGTVRGQVRVMFSPMRLVERTPRELFARLADDVAGRHGEYLEKTRRQVGEPQIRAHFPDPVTGAFSHVAETLLAPLELPLLQKRRDPVLNHAAVWPRDAQRRRNSDAEDALPVHLDRYRATFQHGRGAHRFV